VESNNTYHHVGTNTEESLYRHRYHLLISIYKKERRRRRRITIRTGGASGIGLGITRFLASQTHATLTPVHISIFDINVTAAAKTVSTLQKEFPAISLSFHQCDVASWESQATAFEEVVKHQGRVDYVFANAGVTERGTLIDKNEEKPSKPVLTTLDVNLAGVIYCSCPHPLS
jgi:NAD(P)-dependent dehydrogenase (short-subunit alcohol dehydrogenase family)